MKQFDPRSTQCHVQIILGSESEESKVAGEAPAVRSHRRRLTAIQRCLLAAASTCPVAHPSRCATPTPAFVFGGTTRHTEASTPALLIVLCSKIGPIEPFKKIVGPDRDFSRLRSLTSLSRTKYQKKSFSINGEFFFSPGGSNKTHTKMIFFNAPMLLFALTLSAFANRKTRDLEFFPLDFSFFSEILIFQQTH